MAALGQKNYASVGNMFSQCQEFAVSLGENIEKLAGERRVIVSYLEEYCELLFRIFEKVSSGSVDELKKTVEGTAYQAGEQCQIRYNSQKADCIFAL